MTASQPEGVGAEIQQQAKSNLILNRNYIHVFKCECVVLRVILYFSITVY